MRDFILSFFGAAFIYTGMLAMEEDVRVGVASILIGAALCVKPLMRLIRAARSGSGVRPNLRIYRGYGDLGGVRRPEGGGDHKPTYH